MHDRTTRPVTAQLLVVGVNQETADVDLRARVANSDVQHDLTALQSLLPDDEFFIVSTCRRTEVYAWVADMENGARVIKNFLATHAGFSPSEAASALFELRDAAAVEHVFAVAAGLKSGIIGEGQVLQQIKQAAESARHAGTLGPALDALLRAALRCGKEARADGSILRTDPTIGAAIAALARIELGDLSTRTAVLIGAGQVNRIVAERLRALGVGRLVVVNRTASVAHEMATAVGCDAMTLDQLPALLLEAAVVVTAAHAKAPLVTVAMLADRDARSPLLVLDAGMPPNVDPAVAALPCVRYLDIDDIQAPHAQEVRAEDLRRMRRTVQAHVAEHMAWQRARQVVPLIAALREHVDRQKARETERTLHAVRHLAPDDQQVVADLAQRLVDKMFHHLVDRVKRVAADPRFADSLPILEAVFLEPAHGRPSDEGKGLEIRGDERKGAPLAGILVSPSSFLSSPLVAPGVAPRHTGA